MGRFKQLLGKGGDARAFQVVLVVKNLPANARDIRDTSFIPGLGRCPGGGHGSPLQYFLENPHGQRSLAGYSPRGRNELGMNIVSFPCLSE